MRLYLENIGKINSADIQIKGITVIAGENNTGKSTVGKALYSFFRSFYNFEQQIRNERVESIERILFKALRETTGDLNYPVYRTRSFLGEIVDEIAKSIERSSQSEFNEDHLKDIIETNSVGDRSEKQHNLFGEINYSDVYKKIITVMEITPIELSRAIYTKALRAEFNDQVNNVFNSNPGTIILEISGKEYRNVIADNRVVSISDILDLYTDVVYIDDPYLLDDSTRPYFTSRGLSNHRFDLRAKLAARSSRLSFVDEVVAEKKLDEIMSKLNLVCSGDIVRNRGVTEYSLGDNSKAIDVRNLSMGLKTFVILKELLLNGSIEENGTVIMDEPEIHLHPDWQVRLAELIVLIQKEFGLHILITTHSPYFLNAVEVFSDVHEIREQCHYYLASSDSAEHATISEVTDQIDLIYKKLARPFQDLENIRYQND